MTLIALHPVSLSAQYACMVTRALGRAAATVAILCATGCSDDSKASDVPASQVVATFSEFFVASGDGYVFERVDRATPDPLEASEGETCFTDPAWVQNGAPYDRNESRADLPTGAQRGEVNVMKQCDLPSRP